MIDNLRKLYENAALPPCNMTDSIMHGISSRKPQKTRNIRRISVVLVAAALVVGTAASAKLPWIEAQIAQMVENSRTDPTFLPMTSQETEAMSFLLYGYADAPAPGSYFRATYNIQTSRTNTSPILRCGGQSPSEVVENYEKAQEIFAKQQYTVPVPKYIPAGFKPTTIAIQYIPTPNNSGLKLLSTHESASGAILETYTLGDNYQNWIGRTTVYFENDSGGFFSLCSDITLSNYTVYKGEKILSEQLLHLDGQDTSKLIHSQPSNPDLAKEYIRWEYIAPIDSISAYEASITGNDIDTAVFKECSFSRIYTLITAKNISEEEVVKIAESLTF